MALRGAALQSQQTRCGHGHASLVTVRRTTKLTFHQ